MYYAKGPYAPYIGQACPMWGVSSPRCQTLTPKCTGSQDWGRTLALDLSGNVRFGTDIEWIAPPGEGEVTEDEGAIDFWASHLVDSDAQIPSVYEDVMSYLPNIALEGLRPDYCAFDQSWPHRAMDSKTFRYVRTDVRIEKVGG